jgi:hypothetical protein
MRKVLFELTLPNNYDHLPAPYLLAKNYKKKDVIKCFETLEKLGYGKFDRGKAGRGQIARFYKNDKCPDTFELEIMDIDNKRFLISY